MYPRSPLDPVNPVSPLDPVYPTALAPISIMVSVPDTSFLMKILPSWVLMANSPRSKSTVCGIFPGTAERFVLIILAIWLLKRYVAVDIVCPVIYIT